jgi:DNA-binding winged helix-turn-helix (wHTH) protein
VALLERPGEVVTRVELRRRVWKNGAYVDFDRSLNKAIVSLGGVRSAVMRRLKGRTECPM